jgi:hypothetical protein
MSVTEISAREAWQPVCVGRFTVDLPPDATILPMGQSYNGITIEVKSPRNQTQFEHEAEVAELPGKSLDVPSDLPPSARIRAFDDGSGLQTVRGAVLKGNVAFLLHVQVETESTPGAKVAVANLLRKIRVRDSHEVPAEKGFCIERGFIPGASLEWAETASFAAVLPNSKAEFAFITDTGDAGTSDGLLATMSKLPPALAGFVDESTSTLRKDTRKVVDRKGDEYGYVVKDSSNVALTWRALPGDDRLKQPGLEVRIDTKAGTTQAEREPLLAEWDALLASIRMR